MASKNGHKRISFKTVLLFCMTLLALVPFITVWRPYLKITPRILSTKKYERSKIEMPKNLDGEPLDSAIPIHVSEFDLKNIKLPKYPGSDLHLVSVSSNNTYHRQVMQRFTFGRILDLRFVTVDDYSECVLCLEKEMHNSCHCPSFLRSCSKDIFYDRPDGWWCATRRAVAAIEIAIREWEGIDLPDWLHLIDDNTWINPISERLIIENLDPSKIYFIGDVWNGFAAGGSGMLMSRAVLERLIGPPIHPVVHFKWQNGTHTITPKTQIQSCLLRMQGGDWCYYHGDWAITECMQELGIPVTDIGGRHHSTFFSQLESLSNDRTWFTVDSEISETVHHTHGAALHIGIDEAYHIFYKVVVPYYEKLYKAFDYVNPSEL